MIRQDIGNERWNEGWWMQMLMMGCRASVTCASSKAAAYSVTREDKNCITNQL